MPARGTDSGLTVEQAIFLVENKVELKKALSDFTARKDAAEAAEQQAALEWAALDRERADFAAALAAHKKTVANFEVARSLEHNRLTDLENGVELKSDGLRVREGALRAEKEEFKDTVAGFDAEKTKMVADVAEMNSESDGLSDRGRALDDREAFLNSWEGEISDRDKKFRELINS